MEGQDCGEDRVEGQDCGAGQGGRTGLWGRTGWKDRIRRMFTDRFSGIYSHLKLFSWTLADSLSVLDVGVILPVWVSCWKQRLSWLKIFISENI